MSVYLQKTKRIETGKATVITRMSTILPASANKCEKLSGDGITTTTCWCDKDLCNVAQHSKSKITTTFNISSLVLGLFKRF